MVKLNVDLDLIRLESSFQQADLMTRFLFFRRMILMNEMAFSCS